MKKISSLLACVSLATSCATTTMITTEAPGAKVVGIDEKTAAKKELGVTPYKYETSMWIWESAKVEVSQAEQTKTVELKRSEFDMAPGLGSIAISVCSGGTLFLCVGLPMFLAGGLKLPEKTEVKFDKKSGFHRGNVPESPALAYLKPLDGSVAY